jgi:excisionase family DNA binding protein
MAEPVSAPMSARAAAARCGVSERTLRRWIAAGRLAADRSGGAFLVDLGAVRTLVAAGRGRAADSAAPADMAAASHTELSGVADTGAADTPRQRADSSPGLAALVELVARLHAEVGQVKDDARRHAEAAALWQERAGTLADRLAVAESRLAALEAPKSPPDVSTATQAPELTPEPPAESAPSPWLRLWSPAPTTWPRLVVMVVPIAVVVAILLLAWPR